MSSSDTREDEPGTSIRGDLSRSIDQISTMWSLNLNVPKISSFDDIQEFINEFESATFNLPDNQKISLLTKSFSSGRQRIWFEAELKPKLTAASTWADVKKKIYQRWSETDERDEQFRKLRELKYNPNGSQKLLDFIEEFTYAYDRAFPGQGQDQIESKVKFVKASLPLSLNTMLSVNPDWRDCIQISELKRIAKQYDMTRGKTSDSKPESYVTSSQLASIVKQLVDRIGEDSSSMRREIAAAIQSRPRFDKRYNRSRENSRSPRRDDRRQDHDKRATTPDAGDSQSSNTSSSRQANSKINQAEQGQASNDKNNNSGAFDSELYYKRFGRPPSACSCGSWHWSRHCPDHLN